MKTGRFTIQREPDDQYSLAVFSNPTGETDDDQLEFTTPNLSLSVAFNAARDALAAMAVGAEKHHKITGSTRIK